jgi:hypothetical protein
MNLPQQEFRTQSHICWENFLKGQISRDWLTYVHHIEFRNDIYHQDNEGTIARYKLESLERDMDNLWTRHTELLPKLWDFQKQHFDRRQRIADLRYESKKYWATLTRLYLDDAENNRSGSHSEIEQSNRWRTGVG